MPKGDHILIPETYNYVTSHGKGGFEDVNKLSFFRWVEHVKKLYG